MSKGYAIYLAKNNRTLQVVEFPIKQYAQSQQLFRFMNEHKDGVITCSDLKAAGFEDITREWLYPTSTMGQSGCGRLADDAQIVLNDSGIQTILNRMVSYSNYKASEKINRNRLVRIDYNEMWHKQSLESIEKCIQHFYQLADKLKGVFSEVPGISFVIGEEEVQYGNLHFRILYKGRYFLQLLGKFGNASFIHIINSKHLFPQCDVAIHPFEETCQLHNTFMDIHLQKVSDEEVLQKVAESYNRRFDQYTEVKKQFAVIFKTELNDSDFEYDFVRECVMLRDEAERSIVGELLPEPAGEEKSFISTRLLKRS